MLDRVRSPSPDAGRLGIVGCGLVAERGYLPALAGLRGLRLVAVADPVAERRRLADGVAGYEDLDEMLSAGGLDAVLVCSPPELHLEHAEACARAGIQTLVEKPPGLSLEQTERLAALRPEPLVGFNRRFADGLPVGRGAVDRPTRVTAIFNAPPGDWDRGRPPPDPLLDLGCHLVDLCCWITGTTPARARSMPATPGRVSFELEMSNGLRLHALCGEAPAYRELLELRGEHGEMRSWRWPEPVDRQLAALLSRRPPALVRSWRAQLAAIASVVVGCEARRVASAGEAVKVMAALDAVRASAGNGRHWLTIASAPHPAADELAG
jgi:predicted dehydrogenase